MKTQAPERELHVDSSGRAYIAIRHKRRRKLPALEIEQPKREKLGFLARLKEKVEDLGDRIMRRPLRRRGPAPKIRKKLVEREVVRLQLVSIERQLKKSIMAQLGLSGRGFTRWRKQHKDDWATLLHTATAMNRENLEKAA
jgi:hypothetical protein